MSEIHEILGRIEKERLRQIDEEGYSLEHDEEVNRHRELPKAAAVYACGDHLRIETAGGGILDAWPWDDEAYKPKANQVRNLEIAAALLVAEIQRLENVPDIPAVRVEIRSPFKREPDVVKTVSLRTLFADCGLEKIVGTSPKLGTQIKISILHLTKNDFDRVVGHES